MNIEVKGDNLIITCPINKSFPPSKSGKTKIAFSTNGNIQTPAEVETPNGKRSLTAGINIYFRP